MELSIVLQQRFAQTPDGEVVTDGAFHHAFWDRYLRDFDSVRIVARVAAVPARPDGWRRVDGEGVGVHAIPTYIGPAAFLLHRRAVLRAIDEAMRQASGAILLRTPGILPSLSYRSLRRSRTSAGLRPYGVEVVGDPFDVFAPGVVSHPLRPFFRHHFMREQRRLCRDASAALYVTESTLQARYPTSAFSTSASNVELTDAAFAEGPRLGALVRDGGDGSSGADGPNDVRLRVVLVGSLEQLYKGPDVLLRAMERCRKAGVRIDATIVGEGRRRSEMEDLARRLNLSDHVRFTGQLATPALVRAELDAADAFVLPSRTEGLPRALLEAQARGLPCIASDVGGIPELLPAEAMSAPGDDAALASNLLRLARDEAFRQRLATHGVETARRYREEVLDARRRAFYRTLKEATAAWLRDGRAAPNEVAA